MISKKELLEKINEVLQKYEANADRVYEIQYLIKSFPDDQPAGEAYYPGSYYQPLFDHMSQNHNLTLLQGDMDEIIKVVRNMDHPDVIPFQWPIPDVVEVVTRDGRKVEQLTSFSGNGFAGIINGFDGVYTWREDGRDFGQDIREFDLFLRRKEKKVWVVEWPNGVFVVCDNKPEKQDNFATIYESTLKPVL